MFAPASKTISNHGTIQLRCVFYNILQTISKTSDNSSSAFRVYLHTICNTCPIHSKYYTEKAEQCINVVIGLEIIVIVFFLKKRNRLMHPEGTAKNSDICEGVAKFPN